MANPEELYARVTATLGGAIANESLFTYRSSLSHMEEDGYIAPIGPGQELWSMLTEAKQQTAAKYLDAVRIICGLVVMASLQGSERYFKLLEKLQDELRDEASLAKYLDDVLLFIRKHR